jgi:histidinol-phosphate aminotransferase
MTRRQFAVMPLYLPFQHAAVLGPAPAGTVWLNANENPEGPPEASRAAIVAAVAEAGRYSHRVFPEYYAALAKSVGLSVDEVLAGNGSTEILHCAIDAFTAPDRPLVTVWPTWEMTRDVAEAGGRRVIKVPLTPSWTADVERLADEAKKARAGVVHLGNPNNPTSSATGAKAMAWLVENLPADTVLLVDEAYIQFSDVESCLAQVRAGKSVVVTRTFSKLYGMAGVRAGFGCARADLIRHMTPFRNNVPGILGARAVMAALALGDGLVAGRRARRNRVRAELCRWLDARGRRYIPPEANFVLIDIGRDVSEMITRMLAEGVAVGRKFDGVERWMRVACGTEQEIDKFERAFAKTEPRP